MSGLFEGFLDGLLYGVGAAFLIWFAPYQISKIAESLEHITKQ